MGGKLYPTVQAAVTAAGTTANTIKMLANSTENIEIASSQTITLDLNGFVLKGIGSGSVITNNGTLTIQDSSLELPVIEQNNHRFKVSENGLWENDDSIASDDADYIYDGSGEMHEHKQTVPAITDEGTVIVIYGGVITGGKGTENCESGGVTNNGTFTLASGNIIGNSPADSDGCQGGGVTNNNNGTFVMNGGSIIGNYSYRGGGGVFNYSGTVRVNDGAILFNTAKESGGGIGNDGAVIITGGSIGKNAAGNIGGGIYINGGTNFKGMILGGGSLSIGGTAKIYDNSGLKGNNVVIFSNNPNITIGTSTNGTDGNEVLKPAEGMRVGITLLAAGDEVSAYGAFTTNGAETDKQYFFSDDPAYLVKYNTNHLELVYAPKLYFGMYGGTEQARRFECSIYTDAQRTNAYTGGAGTWSVQWADGKGMQLNLTNFMVYNTLQIDTACFIALTGTNSLDSEDGNGLIISENCDVTFEGTGVLNASSAKNDAVAVNAVVTLNGATVKCSAADADKKDIVFGTNGKVRLVSGDILDKTGASFYPGTLTTLYLAKKTAGSYALYTDFETFNFEYAVAANGVEEQVGSEHYAVVNLTGALDKNITFKQNGDPTYTAALRVNGTVSMMGFDAGENALTILNGGAAVLTANGDIKADKIYLPAMTVHMVNGSFVEASNKASNQLSISGGAAVDLKNGSIDFEKGTVTIGDGINTTAVTIEKNGSNAAEFGIKAHTIHVNKAALTVKDVTTGIRLYDPLRLDDDGATLNLTNGAAVNITASGVGVQGTAGEGGYYYNNITVADTSTITVTGGQKAVASAVISPIPDGKAVSSADPDHKPVTFTINSDANFTTDYYYAGTTTPATALTLIDAVSVTFDTMGGSSTPIAWVAPGTAVAKPADPTRDKSFFSGWYLNGQAFDFSTKLTEDITLEAHWTLEETETGEETTIATDGSTTTKVQVMGDDGVQASGLESVAKEVKADGNTGNNVKIVLTAEKTDENSGNSSEVNAIKTEAGDKSIDLLEIDLTKYINSDTGSKITDTGSNVIEVIIPFSSANKQNIAVYRYHTGAVPPVTVFEEKTKAGADGTFYIENGELHLFTTKFSTYAIGYKTTSGSTGGGGDGTGSLGKKDDKTEEKNIVCPQDETCVYAKFTDSDPKAWYHPGVHFCVEKGYMNGVSATKFDPSGTLSRGMIVTMLWRMEGSPVLNYAMSFRDVAADQWYTEAIRWAQSTGVVTGYSAYSFGPNNNVTREQLAAILMRYAAYKGIDVSKRADLSKFTDAKSVSGWALENVKWANAVGIINGRTETTIAPTGNATRAEAANMVQRFCETILK